MAISIPLRSVTPIFILMDSRFCTVFAFPHFNASANRNWMFRRCPALASSGTEVDYGGITYRLILSLYQPSYQANWELAGHFVTS